MRLQGFAHLTRRCKALHISQNANLYVPSIIDIIYWGIYGSLNGLLLRIVGLNNFWNFVNFWHPYANLGDGVTEEDAYLQKRHCNDVAASMASLFLLHPLSPWMNTHYLKRLYSLRAQPRRHKNTDSAISSSAIYQPPRVGFKFSGNRIYNRFFVLCGHETLPIALGWHLKLIKIKPFGRARAVPIIDFQAFLEEAKFIGILLSQITSYLLCF